MSITKSQKEFIISMDNTAKQILSHGDQEELLMSLCNKMTEIKDIIDSSSLDELNQYCDQYNGFYQYMKLLEKMAQGCADGVFKDLII